MVHCPFPDGMFFFPIGCNQHYCCLPIIIIVCGGLINFSLLCLQKEGKESEAVVEKKFVPRDGSTSLITYPNASNFAVFSHVRNFVLQNQLCEMFNNRFAQPAESEMEEDETEEEAKKRKQHTLSKVHILSH